MLLMGCFQRSRVLFFFRWHWVGISIRPPPLPAFVCFPSPSLQLIIEGRILKKKRKKALCCRSSLGLYRAFKEKEGRGQLVAEHVYSGEMRKAKRAKERGGERKGKIKWIKRGDFWVERGRRKAKRWEWLEETEKSKAGEVGLLRVKEMDCHGGGDCKRVCLWEFQSTLVN